MSITVTQRLRPVAQDGAVVGPASVATLFEAGPVRTLESYVIQFEVLACVINVY